METLHNDQPLNFVFQLFEDTQPDNMNYFYRGFFNQSITDSILQLAERNIAEAEEPAKIKRRVYFIMVESLQNITRYQSKGYENIDKSGVFTIQKRGDLYFITSGNLINNDKIDYVASQLNIVNSLSQAELKNYYKQILKNGRFTNEGGAGLGLIEMARKSGNPLTFDFRKIDEKFSFFYLTTAISPGNDTQRPEREVLDKALKNVLQLHNILNQHTISLLINSGFSQTSLESLLAILEKQLNRIGKKSQCVFRIVAQMLQNIIHYNLEENNAILAKPGVFFIREFNHEYELFAVNYIHNNHVEAFKKQINEAEFTQNEESKNNKAPKFYDFKIERNEDTGLDIIDMKLKNDNQLEIDFYKSESEYSFFVLKVILEKQKTANSAVK